MASNEHAFLSEGNLHNPKGLSLASNNTVCSKNDVGALQWSAKSSIKSSVHTFSAFGKTGAGLLENYSYPEAMKFGQSPYELSNDYGSATISDATKLNQKEFFRIATNVISYNAVVGRCTVQITNDSGVAFTVALVKYTPSNNDSTLAPVVMFEKACTGVSSDNLVISYNIATLDWTNTTVTKGDHLFLMAKTNAAEGAGDVPYIAVTLELGCTDYTVA